MTLGKTYLLSRQNAHARQEAKLAREDLEKANSLKMLQAGVEFDPEGNAVLIPGGQADLTQQAKISGLESTIDFQDTVKAQIEESDIQTASGLMIQGLETLVQTGDIDVIQKLVENNPLIKSLAHSRGVAGFTDVNLLTDTDELEAEGVNLKRLEVDKDYQGMVQHEFHKTLNVDGTTSLGSTAELLLETNAQHKVRKGAISERKKKIDLMRELGLTPIEAQNTEVAKRQVTVQEKSQENQVIQFGQNLDLRTIIAEGNIAHQEGTLDVAKQDSNTRIRIQAWNEARAPIEDAIEASKIKGAQLTAQIEALAPPEKAKVINYANNVVKTRAYALYGVTNEEDYRAAVAKSIVDDPGKHRQAVGIALDYGLLKGIKYSEGTTKSLVNISKIASLADTATGLIDETTGVLDVFVTELTSHTGTDSDDLEALFAYNQLDNIERHELFGSAQSAGELRAHYKGTASSNKKLVPIYSSLINKMDTHLAALDQIDNIKDPFYSGTMTAASRTKLQEVRRVVTLEKARLIKLKTKAEAGISSVGDVPGAAGGARGATGADPTKTITVPQNTETSAPTFNDQGKSASDISNEVVGQ